MNIIPENSGLDSYHSLASTILSVCQEKIVLPPNFSDAKIKEGIFVGPQIQRLILNNKVGHILPGNNWMPE